MMLSDAKLAKPEQPEIDSQSIQLQNGILDKKKSCYSIISLRMIAINNSDWVIFFSYMETQEFVRGTIVLCLYVFGFHSMQEKKNNSKTKRNEKLNANFVWEHYWIEILNFPKKALPSFVDIYVTGVNWLFAIFFSSWLFPLGIAMGKKKSHI